MSELPPALLDSARRLEAQRLLVADRDPETWEPTYEIAHESLLRSWPRLQRWLTQDRDLIRRCGTSARPRRHGGRRPGDSALYRGARLAAADEVLERMPDQLTELEHDFVAASRAAVDAEAARSDVPVAASDGGSWPPHSR